MPKTPITEEQGVHKIWYEQADKVTIEDLPAFLEHLLDDYAHDYGTVCHASAAGAIATCWAMNRAGGGITGFQAGAVMWEFIRGWMSKDEPMRLVSYNDMLYPQYGYKFEKTISPDTWEWLQKEAQKKVDEGPPTTRVVQEEGKPDFEYTTPHPEVYAHWKSIADGVVPFGYEVKDL